jgi:hypothetical protein
MNPRKIRSLVVLTLIVAIAAGAFYMNFNRSTATAIPAPMAMEGADLEGASILTAGAPTTGKSGPIVGNPVRAASFDGDVRDLPQIGPAVQTLMREMGSPDTGESATDGLGPDPVLQTFNAIEAMPGTTSFAGLDLQNWGAGWPPDTNGDVGPTYYIQTVNTSIGIYNKSNGARVAAYTFNTLFAGTGTPCDDKNMGDPVVLYDDSADRWIITDFAWSSTRGPYYECIAVSKTGDPVNGGYWFYALQASSNQLNDYPKLGVWPDAIYMSSNMFTRGKTYAGVKVWALNKDDMYSGAAMRNVAFTLGTSYFTLYPSTVSSYHNVPAGTPNYFMSLYAPSTMRMWKFTVNWNTPSSSTFTGPTNITVASFTKPTTQKFVPQLGSSYKLDTLGDRLMVQIQFTNINNTPALWFTHSVLSNNVTGIRWYEVRNMSGTPSVYQQGTYQPDSNFRFMPSLAVDADGNMAVGYSVSSSAMYPAIRYAGRLVSDPLGTLGQGEATMIAGTGSQTSYSRWGDYSAMVLDPNGCTFWYTTEYYATTGTNWQTRIGSFQFPSCTP